jgi:hypothetical protein
MSGMTQWANNAVTPDYAQRMSGLKPYLDMSGLFLQYNGLD